MPHEVDDDIEEQQFAEALAAKRHKEQMSSLKGIASLLNKPQKEDGVAEAIKQSTEATKGLIQAVKDIPKQEKPEVTVQVSQQEIVTSLQGICDKIVENNEMVIEALKNKPIVDEFTFIFDSWGNYKTAKVVYKSPNK